MYCYSTIMLLRYQCVIIECMIKKKQLYKSAAQTFCVKLQLAESRPPANVRSGSGSCIGINWWSQQIKSLHRNMTFIPASHQIYIYCQPQSGAYRNHAKGGMEIKHDDIVSKLVLLRVTSDLFTLNAHFAHGRINSSLKQSSCTPIV